MVRSATERSPFLYVAIATWIVCAAILVHNGLSILALIGSALGALWIFGFGEKFPGDDTESAYSVFNKGGRAILGGYTGEQLDRQLRGGLAADAARHHRSQQNSGVDSNDQPLVTTSTNANNKKVLSPDEKKKQRLAAAEAAERRLAAASKDD